MLVTRSQYLKVFLYIGIFYYLGIVDFFNRIITGNTRNVRVLNDGSDALLNNAGGNLIAQGVGGLILLMSVYYVMKFQPSIIYGFFRRYASISFVLVLVIASIFWSVEVAISFRRVVALVTVFLFAIIVAEAFDPEFILFRIARVIGYCALAGFFYVVVDPANALISEGIRESAFLGIFYDKNGGARAYAYAAIILFRGVIQFSKRDIALFSVLLAAILMAQSATALMLCTVGCFLVILFVHLNSAPSRIQSRWQVYVGIVLILIGLVLAYLSFEFVLALLGRDPTLTNRTIIWELLWPSVEDKFLLGYGYGAYWSSVYVDGFVERWGFIGNAHNGYIDVMLHGGVVMLLAFVMLFLKGLRQCAYNISCSHGWNVYIPMWIIMMFMVLVNAVGTIIPNHKSLDMFLLAIILAFSLKEYFYMSALEGVKRGRYAY